MLLAAPYLLLAHFCAGVIEDGGPGWLNLVVLVACWNFMKFALMGPISVGLLIRVRIQEAIARRRERKEARDAASGFVAAGGL
ncbi:hypothetical protein DVJ78_11025 [Humibacter sp. BT305]|nr:hypothetical protein DVJ78_11025 [Humibacter sp. BT305]